MASSPNMPACLQTWPTARSTADQKVLVRKKQPPRKIDDKAARQALKYDRAERQRESERRKEEAARAMKRQRREQAIAKAQAALEKAERKHDTRASAIEAERAAVERRSQ